MRNCKGAKLCGGVSWSGPAVRHQEGKQADVGLLFVVVAPSSFLKAVVPGHCLTVTLFPHNE